MYEVIALGELLIDFTLKEIDEKGYPTMIANPGGAPANFLSALSRFGRSTGFIGKVGNDFFGRSLKSTLEEIGIGTEGLVIDDNVFTTLAFVTIDKYGDREFSFARKPGADMCLRSDELDTVLFDNAKVFHFGTLSLTDEPSISATHRAVEIAREKRLIISFDPNLRPPLWHNIESAREAINWGLSVSDIVKISDNEVSFLFGTSPEEGLEKILSAYSVKLAYVTCGANGSVWGNHNYKGRSEALKGVKPVDTTGAGDIFGGSAMFAFLSTGKTPSELSEIDLQRIVRFANVSAGLSTLRMGGIFSVPELNEVLSRMED